MKKLLIILMSLSLYTTVSAQEFAKRSTEAKTAYAAGKLDDARFAMQQMLQEIDIISGKEVLKVLPAKMGDKAANTSLDNVSGSSAFFGVIIHREYGTAPSNASLEIISNSPLVSSINALLSIPFMGSSGDQKIIKVNGYKGLVQKVSGANNTEEYELQLPLNNTLITLKTPGSTQDQLIQMANTLPVAEIAKFLQ